MTRSPRRTASTRAAAVVTLAAVAALAGCGSGGVASDPAASSSPTHGGRPTIETPVGERPAFTAEDYSYGLRVSCFCPQAGSLVRITVTDGEVSAVDGTPRAPDVPSYLRITIPEIIDRALDPRVDEVTLHWPQGQAWPDNASLDPMRDAVDDEIAYTISDVEISG